MPSSMCVSNGLTSLRPGVQAELYLWAFYNSTCIKSTCPFLMLAYVTGPLLSFLGTYPFLVEHIQQQLLDNGFLTQIATPLSENIFISLHIKLIEHKSSLEIAVP